MSATPSRAVIAAASAPITCATCRQCDGTERGARRPSFSLYLH